MTDTEAMHEALSLAREAADEGEVPVGCIVTDGEHIVGAAATAARPAKARWPTRSWRPLPRPAARSAAGGCGAARSMSRLSRVPCAPGPSSTPGSTGWCSAPGIPRRAPADRSPICFPCLTTISPPSKGGLLEEECGRVLSDFFRSPADKRRPRENPADEA